VLPPVRGGAGHPQLGGENLRTLPHKRPQKLVPPGLSTVKRYRSPPCPGVQRAATPGDGDALTETNRDRFLASHQIVYPRIRFRRYKPTSCSSVYPLGDAKYEEQGY